jgi:pimeloyl-ACP methyl ester carboxylesterase
MAASYSPRRVADHRQVTVRGLRHHVTAWPGEGPPVVLLHGFMDSGATFQFLADALDDGRALVAPDWRGFGRSEWARDGYWFAEYFADLDALLDQLVPDAPADIVGHSMGGNIALGYAGLRPDRLRRLVTLEGFGLPDATPDLAPTRYGEWLEQLRNPQPAAIFPSLESLATVLCKRNPRLPFERALFIAGEWSEPLPDGRVQLRFDPAHRRVHPVLYRRAEAEACWRRIRAPVAHVAGSESDFLARLNGAGDPDAMRRHIPRLQAHLVAGAGHMLHHEQPEAVARIVERFLRPESQHDETIRP